MASRLFTLLLVLATLFLSNADTHSRFVQVGASGERDHAWTKPSSSPFDSALETLQKHQINYTFRQIGLLRRAMTHASFSEENNKALGILGSNVIDTSVSLRYLQEDIDISPKDLNRRVAEFSQVETSCAGDGRRLGLHKIVRVSPKTDSSAPAVVCGAFRAIFGAIALDSGKSDDAGSVFWSVHGKGVGKAFVL